MQVSRFSIRVLLLLMGLGSAQWQCRSEPQPSQEEGTEMRERMIIEEAKKKWEAKLMAIEGVNGVGIGLTKDKKDKCIKVYVQSKTSPAPGKIPDRIEGYAVEVEVRGTFRAR